MGNLKGKATIRVLYDCSYEFTCSFGKPFI